MGINERIRDFKATRANKEAKRIETLERLAKVRLYRGSLDAFNAETGQEYTAIPIEGKHLRGNDTVLLKTRFRKGIVVSEVVLAASRLDADALVEHHRHGRICGIGSREKGIPVKLVEPPKTSED